MSVASVGGGAWPRAQPVRCCATFRAPPTRPSSRVRAQKADLPTRGRWFEVYCHCALELRESFGRDEFRTMDVVNLTTVIHVDEMCYEPTVRRHGKRPCIRISLKSGRS